jgi:hypothetical protein
MQPFFSTPAKAKEAAWVQVDRFPTAQRKVEQVNLDIQAPNQRTDAPLCGVHGTPMSLVIKSTTGPFYSCHKRLADGSWCSYRP